MSQVKSSWAAPGDNVEVAGYLVERQDHGSTSFVHLGTSTGTSYNDNGLAAGSTYVYRTPAMNAARNPGEYSHVASAATLRPEETPRDVPSRRDELRFHEI